MGNATMHLNFPYPTCHAGRPPIRHVPFSGSSANLVGIDLNTPLLVIEDEAMIAWMLETMLEAMGFGTIKIAPTGDEALRLADATPPGLVISDINLGSSIDGVAAATAIRAAHASPVIFVTGHVSAEAYARIEVGLPSAIVLRKPVSEAELRIAISRALRPSMN